MKRVLGWPLFVVLLPFVMAGFAARFVVEGCIYGWELAEDAMEEWDD